MSWEEQIAASAAESDQYIAAYRENPELEEINGTIAEAIAALREKHAELGIPRPNTYAAVAAIASLVIDHLEGRL